MLLYSTNPFLKLFIQEQYFKDVHYVWCSESFDSKTLPRYRGGSLVGASSNPANIYRQLHEDVRTNDLHSDRIKAQKTSYKNRALDWYDKGIITQAVCDDIVYLSDNATFDQWRPLIYVIPRSNVETRLKVVPASARAGLGVEYIIEDLKRSEFDIIEL